MLRIWVCTFDPLREILKLLKVVISDLGNDLTADVGTINLFHDFIQDMRYYSNAYIWLSVHEMTQRQRKTWGIKSTCSVKTGPSIDRPYPHKVFVTSSGAVFVIYPLRLEDLIPGLWRQLFHYSQRAKQLHMIDVISESRATGVMVTQIPFATYAPATTILSHTEMPCLESLTLWKSLWDPAKPLQRSACALKTPEQAFIDVFQCTPKLQQLSIKVANSDSEARVVTL